MGDRECLAVGEVERARWASRDYISHAPADGLGRSPARVIARAQRAARQGAPPLGAEFLPWRRSNTAVELWGFGCGVLANGVRYRWFGGVWCRPVVAAYRRVAGVTARRSQLSARHLASNRLRKPPGKFGGTMRITTRRASSGVQGGLCSSWRLRGMARPCDNRPSGTPRAYEAHPVERLVPRYDR